MYFVGLLNMDVLLIDNHTIRDSSYIRDFKKTLEDVGTKCEIRYFSNELLFTNIDHFDAVILGGSAAYLSKDETINQYQSIIDFVYSSTIPILGVCFGHQLIGIAFDSQIVPLGKDLEAFCSISIRENSESNEINDPLFHSLPGEIQVFQWNSEEVEHLPPNFKLLAYSKDTAIESMIHKSRLIYGIQFHAELYNSENMDGKIVLQNFLNMILSLQDKPKYRFFTLF